VTGTAGFDETREHYPRVYDDAFGEDVSIDYIDPMPALSARISDASDKP
jgi:hypothetical protein